MNLTESSLTKEQITSLSKKNIYTVEELLYTEPLKYLYFDKTYALILTPELQEKIKNRIPVAILGNVKKVDYEFKKKTKLSLTKIRVEEPTSGKLLFINIIGAYKMTEYYKSLIGRPVIVAGRLEYSPEYNAFTMMRPEIFSEDIVKYNRILPRYHKYGHISEDELYTVIEESVKQISDIDYVPSNIIEQYKLFTHKQACIAMHFPRTSAHIRQAKKRKIFDDMLYFNCKLQEQEKLGQIKSPFVIKKTEKVTKLIQDLPFILTTGQRNAIQDMLQKAKAGDRISALVHGDVGSGKTIVAFAMMIAMVENGYQAVLMAPTAVLARQHYLDLKEKAEKFGFKVVLLSNELRVSERKKTLKAIESGEANLIVGTHSCVSKGVIFANLGITITDEEHKFGVVQRENLVQKGASGVHHLTMSGTPIPRTLANTLYGNHTTVYSMELPGNRKPIQTAVCKSDKTILQFAEKEIRKGHQCYVVSPLIEKAADGSAMDGVRSLEQNAKIYTDYFEPKGIKVGVISGKTKKDEQEEIVKGFVNNEIQILMATTVVEVGINVPNATLMVICSAERFGLATLHQLRGRVGRGEHQSYCILQRSARVESTGYNLEVLCNNTDGLEIAKADLKNRGMGNIIGTAQSGFNKYVEEMLTYPNMHEKVKEIAKKMCKTRTGIEFIERYEEFYTTE